MKLDRSGNWCWPAHWRLSPNCGERPSGERISLIVLHGISLPPGEFGTGCPEALFLNRLVPQRHREFEDLSRLRVSAHVLIERDGTVTQFVPFRLCAWHAGVSSYQGREGCNDFSIGIELEGTDCQPYETEQYLVLARLVCCLRRYYSAIGPDAVVGHEHVAPGRKSDPGPAFDWQLLRTLLNDQMS